MNFGWVDHAPAVCLRYNGPELKEGHMPQVSEPGNSVYLQVGIWWDEPQGEIHLTVKGVHGFHTTVKYDPDSVRGHPNLFRKLASVLRDNGAPHPAIAEEIDA